MKANEYLKKIQRLNSEAEKVMRQISVLSEIAEKISCDSLADMLDDIIEDIYETHSSLTEKVSLMISNITNLDEPLESAVLIYHFHRGYSWSKLESPSNMPGVNLASTLPSDLMELYGLCYKIHP